MIQVGLMNGIISYPDYQVFKSFKEMNIDFQKELFKLKRISKADLLELFDVYSKNLLHAQKSKLIEGVAFLSNWLRKSNFSKIVEKNLGTMQYLEEFVGERKKLKAQPRGIVCHWIAGNVPTLGLFSLFQSIFAGNVNLMRIPVKSHQTMISLLEIFGETQIDSGLSGKDILPSIMILYYPHEMLEANQEFSMLADVRVVWGGSSAVKAITGLPARSHCEDIIFGPKYSFAVFDSESIQAGDFSRTLRFLVSDTALFDQAACTSPHVVFFEKSNLELNQIGEILAEEFRKFSKRYPKEVGDPFILSKIINIRAEYALDTSKSVIFSKENDWTILINQDIQLEDPIESRTIFLKEIESLDQIYPLITKKVQTIGCSFRNKAKFLEFADRATFQGVARCVKLGQMHLYDSPWDGLLFISRLVNWVTAYTG